MSLMDDYQQRLMLQQQTQSQNPNPMQQVQQMLATGQQGQAPQMPRNPLSNGATSALEMTKRSMQMSDEEHQNAIGKAFLAFGQAAGQQVPQEGAGFAGALGRFNAALGPAGAAYNEEKQYMQKQNFMLQKMLKEEELDREKMRTNVEHHKAMQEHHKGQLGVQRERLELDKAERQAEIDEANLLNKPGGRIPLSAFKSPSNMNRIQNYYDKNDTAINSNSDIYNTASRLEQIFDKYPDALKRINKTSYLIGKDDDGATLRRYLVSQGVKEDDLAVYELAAKDFAKLRVQGISAFTAGGNRHNMAIDKLVAATVPGTHYTPRANREIVSLFKKEAQKHRDAHLKTRQAYEEGYFERAKVPTENEPEPMEQAATTSMGSEAAGAANPADAYSPEQLKRMLQEGNYAN